MALVIRFNPWPWGAGLLALCAAAGCAPQYEDLRTFTQGHEQQVGAAAYRLAPPDVVAISSPTAAEIDGDIQPIRSDGKISLRLLGEVQAAGLTPTELAGKLEEQLSKYYVSPAVNVRVAGFKSQKLYIFGHVNRTGMVPFTGRDTVLDVLANAGLARGAWGSNVKVIRPSADEKARHEITVDVDRIMQTGDLKSNLLLQPGDIIYVPPTPFVWAGLALQEVMFPVREAADAYTLPAQVIGATDYYQDRDSGRTYIRLSPTGSVSAFGGGSY